MKPMTIVASAAFLCLMHHPVSGAALDVPDDMKKAMNHSEFVANTAQDCHIDLTVYKYAGTHKAACQNFLDQAPMLADVLLEGLPRWWIIEDQAKRTGTLQQRFAWSSADAQLLRDKDSISKTMEHLEFVIANTRKILDKELSREPAKKTPKKR